MKRLFLTDAFVTSIQPETHKKLLATIRIYSVLVAKVRNVVSTFEQRVPTPEFVNLYCDLFATFHEGSKKYFQEYISTILTLKNEPMSTYEKEMTEVFQKGNEEKYPNYKVLNYIRNNFSFHFSTSDLPEGLSSYIGNVDELGHVTFLSSIPSLFKSMEKILGTTLGKIEVQTFFRETFQTEVKGFVEYLETVIHKIVDSNSQMEDKDELG